MKKQREAYYCVAAARLSRDPRLRQGELDQLRRSAGPDDVILLAEDSSAAFRLRPAEVVVRVAR